MKKIIFNVLKKKKREQAKKRRRNKNFMIAFGRIDDEETINV